MKFLYISFFFTTFSLCAHASKENSNFWTILWEFSPPCGKKHVLEAIPKTVETRLKKRGSSPMLIPSMLIPCQDLKIPRALPRRGKEIWKFQITPVSWDEEQRVFWSLELKEGKDALYRKKNKRWIPLKKTKEGFFIVKVRWNPKKPASQPNQKKPSKRPSKKPTKLPSTKKTKKNSSSP